MVEKETKSIVTDYPEYENIRKTILNAKEDVITTVNFAMVTAYWTKRGKTFDRDKI